MDDIALTFWYTTQYLYSIFVSFHQKTFFAAQGTVFPARTLVRALFYILLYAMRSLPIGISPAIRMVKADVEQTLKTQSEWQIRERATGEVPIAQP